MYLSNANEMARHNLDSVYTPRYGSVKYSYVGRYAGGRDIDSILDELLNSNSTLHKDDNPVNDVDISEYTVEKSEYEIKTDDDNYLAESHEDIPLTIDMSSRSTKQKPVKKKLSDIISFMKRYINTIDDKTFKQDAHT
jgi:hypothetical protein